MAQTLLLIILSISFGYGTFIPVQQKAAPKTEQPGKTDSLLCREWTLAGIEEFGVLNKLSEKQKADGASFSLDKKVTWTQDGNSRTGTWSADKAKTNVTIAFDGGTEKRLFKVIRLAQDSLTLEYKDAALVKTRFVMLKK